MIEDGRKNNGGNKNAGRKPKIDEITLIETMDAVLVPKEIWIKLADRVKDNDVNAIKTWLGYRFGMPKQIINQTNVNVDATNLTDEEVKLINNNLEQSY